VSDGRRFLLLSGELLASRGGWPNLKGSIHHARNHYPAVSGLQKPQLLDHQEQEDDDRASGDVEVLQSLPEAHGPQRDKVGLAVQAEALRAKARTQYAGA